MILNDEYFMSLALKEARLAYLKEEVPVGAVLVIDNKVISKGHNFKKSNNPIAHAECVCINKACKKLNTNILDNATLYVTCEPCVMCAGLILNTRIKRLVYGTKEPKFGAIESIIDLYNHDKYPFNHQVNVTSGILKEECSKILKDFFKELRTK